MTVLGMVPSAGEQNGRCTRAYGAGRMEEVELRKQGFFAKSKSFLC